METPKQKVDEVIRKISSIQDDISYKVAGLLPGNVGSDIAGKLADVKRKLQETGESLPDPLEKIMP